MTKYIYDESDGYFRSPDGALEAPGTLTVRIKLLRGEASDPRVCLCPDGGEILSAAMEFDRVAGAYDVYKYEFNIETPGLYWYRFIIDTGGGSGFTVPEQAGGGFQVTVHAHVAVTPDWIQGGLIYHIFVDRFRRGGELQLRPGAVYRDD